MKTKKIIAFLLAMTVCFGMIGCKKPNDGDGGENGGDPTPPVVDYTEHKVEGTLHKISVTDTERTFVKNGASEYKIVVSDDVKVKQAGDFISKHVSGATGVMLQVVNESEVTTAGKHIVLDCDGLFAAAGLSMPQDDIGETGYYIKNVGDTYFIQTNHVQAYQLAVLAFLREVIGYDMFADECVIYEKSGETLPDMEIIERPDIDYRLPGNIISQSERYGMGFTLEAEKYMTVTDDSGEYPASGYHNCLNILPPKTYEADHPEWYATLQSGTTKQLCYTAHGDYDSYRLMVEKASEKLIATIDNDLNYDTLNFGIMDGREACGCDYCKACENNYGGVSSTIIMFLNDLDEIIQKHLADKAEADGTEKREFYLTFFAYHGTQAAPVIKNGAGSYSMYTADYNSRFAASFELPADNRELKCNEHVGVLVAPIETIHTHSFYESVNERHYDDIMGWDLISDYYCMWYYQSLYHDDYFYPLSLFDDMVENYRLAREVGTRIMFYQGNMHNNHNPGFTRLKRYIESKAGLDVNVNTQELIDKFFKYYYGSGGEEMKEMFEQLQAWMAYLEIEYPGEVTGSSYDTQVSKASHWPKRLLDGWMDLVDKAYEKVDTYDGNSPEKQEAYRLHIRAESILPRWSLLNNYEGYFSSQQLTEMRREFKNDCTDLGLMRQREGKVLDLSSWNV